MRSKLWLAAVIALVVSAGCGGGEDRPGQVSSEGGDAGSTSASGSASGAGGEHGGAHEGPGSEPAFAEGDETTKVEVTLQDYAFTGIPDTVKGPAVLFSAEVNGGNTHEIQVIDAGGQAVGVVHGFKTGTTKKLAVALEPGTYSAQCLIKEGSRTHADLGMKKTFTVE